MFKHHAWLTCITLQFLQIGECPAQDSDQSKTKSCGAVLFNVCLPDQLKSREPFRGPDFIVNEINLQPVGHVAIYQGIGLSEQDDVTGITKDRSYGGDGAGADVYVGSSTHGRYFDVHYTIPGAYGVVQIFGYLTSAQEAQSVGRFISAIRICPTGAEPCKSNGALASAGDYIASLK